MGPQPHMPSSDSPHSLKDYVAIFSRRRTLILMTGGILLLASLAAAFLWPPTYKSMATILIEEQEIPTDLVRSTITSYADQRIETIKQQVMSRTTLWKVVEQFDLYQDLRTASPAEEVVKRFIKDIQVEVISADVVDKRTQHATKATIAFTVAYQSKSPDLAQKVANELTSLFLGENLKSRERQAQEATSFLQQEAENLAKHIGEIDDKIAGFKQRAQGALPELMPLNQQLMNQSDRELMDVDQQIRTLEERKNYLEGELATIKPNSPMISASGERILDSADRLRSLRAEYAGATGNLAPDHPDIVKMKQEIEALEKETGHLPEVEEASKQLVDARASLATISERLGSEHPDVVTARQRIAALEKEVRTLRAVPLRKNPAQRPENPAYINLQAQLNSATSTLDALRKTKTDVKRRIQSYATRLEKTPELEPEYLVLIRDRDTSGQKYQDIRSRLLEAKVSEGLEVQRKGERFSLIDPPSLPEKPDKPNRLAIVLLGLILAVGGGLGSGAAAESLDHSIRSPEQLAQLTHMFPLAVVPFMPNEQDLSKAVAYRRLVRGAGVGAVAMILVLLHAFVMPLDVLWFAALRRFGIE
ncbi:GumC family protein [Nitrospira lenta]|uniref:Putative Lipopolysaccharide biosynthesis protein n=1 Tax=Nitrospira lenta TaxID=1436998 RepID=A0A330L8A7_9BACT|nr:Wzz/FepE/Etk N-terminal domain-containing protein [Nitrospira lenta]SPP66223.1 putative Lipopolysaccharide biosynthesis protein [Nitrospira lenta]